MLETYRVRKKDRKYCLLKVYCYTVYCLFKGKKSVFLSSRRFQPKTMSRTKRFSSKSYSQMINEQNGTNPIAKK